MEPNKDRAQHVCVACGRGLPDAPDVSRCPHCGARVLWRPESGQPSAGMALFAARMCGIMAGLQIGLIWAIVTARSGTYLPALLASFVVLPVVGYIVLGTLVARVDATGRPGLVSAIAAVNMGLAAMQVAGVLGVNDLNLLASFGLIVAAVSRHLIAASIAAWLER